MESALDLLGLNEDGMTSALGWAASRNPAFLHRLSTHLGLRGKPDDQILRLQTRRLGHGRTDLEILSPGLSMVIIEAKKGFVLPARAQLERYVAGAKKRKSSDPPLRCVGVLTGYPEVVSHQLSDAPKEIRRVPVHYLSWQTVLGLAVDSAKGSAGSARKAIDDFIRYLRKAVAMRDVESNLVYVVPLSYERFDGGPTTFVEVVEKYHQYFHPVGDYYPTEPPNYVGFRYGGKLQSIHFIERVRIITSFKKHFPGVKGRKTRPHFLYDLGPAIKPPKIVKSGPIRNMRCSCALDALLTCGTVQEARDVTKKRLSLDVGNLGKPGDRFRA